MHCDVSDGIAQLKKYSYFCHGFERHGFFACMGCVGLSIYHAISISIISISMDALKTGAVLQNGKYRIERVLGQGGFGITYLAMQTNLGRLVTVKEFFMKGLCGRDETTSQVSVPSTGSRDAVLRFRSKFVKEAQTIARLDCEHIIRIYDVFEEYGTAYYVMDYIAGGSLSDRVRDNGPMDWQAAIRYVCQVAEALGYIHSRHINHLDIKPANILVDDRGQAVVIDFGVSKRYDAEGTQTSTTPVGLSHGYAPLEQYKDGGVSSLSPQSDIYALGATLYYLLTAVVPPDATTLLTEDFPAGALTDRHVPPAVIAVVRKAMSLLPKDRYQSAGEMAAALASVVGDEATVVDGGKQHPAASVPQGSAVRWQWKRAALMLVLECLMVNVWTSFTGAHSFWDSLRIIWNGYTSPDLPEVYFTVAGWGFTAIVFVVVGWLLFCYRNIFLHLFARYAAFVSIFAFSPFVWLVRPADTGDVYGLDTHTAFFALALLSAFAFALPLSIGKDSFLKTVRQHWIQATVAVLAYVFCLCLCIRANDKFVGGQRLESVDLGLSVNWAATGIEHFYENKGFDSYPSYGFSDENYEKVMDEGDMFCEARGLEEVHGRHPVVFMDVPQVPCRLTVLPFNGKCTDNNTITRYWGRGWRMPTKKEMQELVDKCTWTWSNEYYGYRVTGKNGHSIFLRASGRLSLEEIPRKVPADGRQEGDREYCGRLDDSSVAGYYLTGDITKGGDGHLQVNFLHMVKPDGSRANVKIEHVDVDRLSYCLSIRPVCDK